MASAFLQGAESTTDATSYTFSSQNTGTAAADRYILVGVGGRKSGTTTGTVTCTVGGNSATAIASATRWTTATNATYAGLYLVALPTGTSDDVVVDFGALTMLRVGIAMWRLDDLASATASDADNSGANAPSVTIDVPNDGVGVGFAFSGTTNIATSWTGLNEDIQEVVGAEAGTYSGAHTEFPTGSAGLTVTCTFTTPVESSGVFATWAFGAVTGNPWYYFAQQRAAA